MIEQHLPAAPVADTLAARVERHLLYTVGVAPAHASGTDLMSAVSQVARAELSRRWVAGEAAVRIRTARGTAALRSPVCPFIAQC